MIAKPNAQNSRKLSSILHNVYWRDIHSGSGYYPCVWGPGKDGPVTFNDGVSLFAAETLKRQIRDGRPFDAALIKLSGLEDLRRSAGADWPRLKEKIRFSSICFLKQRLGRGDIALPSGAGFLVIYGPAPPRNMADDCDLMQRTLCGLYYREAALRGLRVEVTAHRLEARHVAALGARPGTSFYGPKGQFRGGGPAPEALNAREMR